MNRFKISKDEIPAIKLVLICVVGYALCEIIIATSSLIEAFR